MKVMMASDLVAQLLALVAKHGDGHVVITVWPSAKALRSAMRWPNCQASFDPLRLRAETHSYNDKTRRQKRKPVAYVIET